MSLERRVELVRKNGQMVILITSERGMMFEYWDNTPYSLDGKRIPIEERLPNWRGVCSSREPSPRASMTILPTNFGLRHEQDS